MGRKIATCVGIWLVIKNIINLVLGFSVGNLISLIAAAAVVYIFNLGIPYANYIIAAVMAIVVIKNLPYNISHVQILYLAEAVIDVIGIYILAANREVREHFKRM